MNITAAEISSRFVTIGRVTRPFGRHGEVVVRPAADGPERFIEIERVYLGRDGEAPVEFDVRSVRIHKGFPTLALESIDGIGAAESLSGSEVFLPATDLPTLAEGSYYHYELVGLLAKDARRGELGIVDRVMSTGGTDLLVVRSEDSREILIPFCPDICPRVDLERGVVEVDAVEGLLDVNAD